MDQVIYLGPIMLYLHCLEKVMDYRQVQLVDFVVCFLNSLRTQNQIKIYKNLLILQSYLTQQENFRNEIYKEYKANRSDPPDDLAPQFEYIRKSVLAFNLPSVDLINYEADDLIATYVDKILEKGAKVTIVSSDKDLMQLYKKNVRIFDL